MKNFLISNLVISFIISFNFSFSQELPEIPMKNGMAYYTFEHKLDNTKNCLSKYFFGYPIYKNTSDYANQFTTKSSGIYKSVILNIYFNGLIFNVPKCNDTLKIIPGFTLTKSGEIFWRPVIIELLRKKTTGSEINAQIEIIFLSKTEYKLIFKGLQYKISWTQGIGNKNGIDIYNIGELYEKTKASGKITKSDIKFFENLNLYTKTVDEIILKALTELYKADDL
jgi:hypothetical protein